jgi:hypothetical protein
MGHCIDLFGRQSQSIACVQNSSFIADVRSETDLDLIPALFYGKFSRFPEMTLGQMMIDEVALSVLCLQIAGRVLQAV